MRLVGFVTTAKLCILFLCSQKTTRVPQERGQDGGQGKHLSACDCPLQGDLARVVTIMFQSQRAGAWRAGLAIATSCWGLVQGLLQCCECQVLAGQRMSSVN